MRRDFWTGQSYEEELAVTTEAVDMSRIGSGKAPVLNGHEPTLENTIGVIDRAWLENGEGRATLRLSSAPEHASIVRNIQDGIIQNISVGYAVRKYEITPAQNRNDGGSVPLYRAVSWMPAEISFVAIGFDAAASTRAAEDGAQCEFITITAEAPAEAIRAAAQITKETTMPNSIDTGGAPATPTEVAAPAAAPQAAPVADTRSADIADLCTAWLYWLSWPAAMPHPAATATWPASKPCKTK